MNRYPSAHQECSLEKPLNYIQLDVGPFIFPHGKRLNRIMVLIHSLLKAFLSSVDNLCKQFGPR